MTSTGQFSWKGPLNDFQKLMREWAALAPYNAGHVLRISGPLEIERWRAAFADAIRPLGLADDGGFPVELCALEIDRKVEEELNTPFGVDAVPLRIFAVPDQRDSHLIGLIFDHWFADSASIRALMRRAFANYSGGAENIPPLRMDEHQSLLGRAPRVPWTALFLSARNYFRHRRAYRIPPRDSLDFGTGFFSLHFPTGAIDHIRAVAKKNGVTVNDLFLATAAQVLGEFTAKKRKSKKMRARRDRIGVAAPVDLRSRADDTVENVFGFSLGYLTVVLDQPEDRSLRELTAAIARETSASKGMAQQFVWNMRVARWFWDRLSRPQSRPQFFQKIWPLVAGISNVNLTGSWADQEPVPVGGRAVVLDYLRISPVGPLLPLVFTLTTIRDRLSLGVTFRTTTFSRVNCERLATNLRDRLCQSE